MNDICGGTVGWRRRVVVWKNGSAGFGDDDLHCDAIRSIVPVIFLFVGDIRSVIVLIRCNDSRIKQISLFCFSPWLVAMK